MEPSAFSLTETQRQFRDTLRKFAEDRVAPQADEADRDATFPQKSFDACVELELPALGIPVAYGGAGGSSGTSALSSTFLYTTSGIPDDTETASMTTGRAQLAGATDSSSRAYAIGGVNSQGQNLATVERYDPTTNTWTLVAPLPVALSGAGAAYDGNGSIYVVGGSTTAGGTTGSDLCRAGARTTEFAADGADGTTGTSRRIHVCAG